MNDNDYKIGDPVTDLAQGRPMVIVNTPDKTVAEWSDENDYDLLGNYANAKFDPEPGEPVVETVYVSDVRSEPSKTYTFPVSRVALIDVHHADDGRRVYDRVAVDVLRRLFIEAIPTAPVEGEREPTDLWNGLRELVGEAGFEHDAVNEARELADVERRFGGEGDGE